MLKRNFLWLLPSVILVVHDGLKEMVRLVLLSRETILNFTASTVNRIYNNYSIKEIYLCAYNTNKFWLEGKIPINY